MEIIKWANEMGYTIKVTEPERRDLIDLLKHEIRSIEIDGDTYELEITNG